MRLTLALLIAAAATLLLTPLIARLARRIGAVDQPRGRHAHRLPTPTLGGLAIFAAFWLAILVLRPWSGEDPLKLFGLLSGAVLLVAVSVVDDLRGVSPALRIVVQATAGAVAWAFGVRIEGLTQPFAPGPVTLAVSPVLSLPLTVLWVVVVVNALNWLDGLDGLAAGVAAIAGGTIAFVAWRHDQLLASVVGAAAAGACVGFLRYNFSPARIFMGDTGAMFLGFVLACAAVMGLVKTTAAVAIAAPVPLLVLGVPLYDFLSTIVKRLWARQPIYSADRQHLHHRLQDLGWSDRTVVLVIWGVEGALCAIAVALR